MKLNARQLRYHRPTTDQLSSLRRNLVYIVLDNVLDTYNIGSIFRLADAVAAEKIILCGQTATPPDIKIHRAAIGTEEWVPWQYMADTKTAILNLKFQVPGLVVYAIEKSQKSIAYNKVDYKFPAAFVVGNETNGVSGEVLKIADKIVEIPMWGFNKSLNVMISLAIVLWEGMEEIK
ncbi:RNA methyltransferase [Candidatus Shapirobacteria bacterium CG09_land_8_20_14_0_10_38_17]|uniref:RNA methyltransferase n=1 Tax=Candidatus Shapirobacteria bacterium CG09_land_8_20_14_0_10_38_17 TaxID=1974884 RepID=A0A2H0WRX7_9BACT|nr:MAG: RNA methyltransferase [Candidatus Shapirobacteria bacterium CG09_land_8_20_14_0_10_38_17]